jgi:hypothetical protein
LGVLAEGARLSQPAITGAHPVIPRPPIRRATWKRLALVVVAAMLGVEIAFVAPYLGRATSYVGRPDFQWVAVAGFAELLSMGAFAHVQRRMLLVGGPSVRMRRMAVLTYAANAMSATLPGGTALSSGYIFKRLRSWGVSVPAAGFTLLASAVLSTLSFALLALVCAALAGSGSLGSIAALAGAAVAATAAVLLRRRDRSDLLIRLASRALAGVNRIVRRAPGTGLDGLHRIVRDLSAMQPRSRDWLAGFGFAELNWIADLACLAACCRAVGAPGPSLMLVAVAYVAGMSASSISLLPGGLGVVDAAMIFALTQGGVSAVSAAAGVLLYRLISFALVVAPGWLFWGATWLVEQRRAAGSAQTASST